MEFLENILIKICGELPLSAILRKFLQINIWGFGLRFAFCTRPNDSAAHTFYSAKGPSQVICVYVKDNPDGLSPCQVPPLCAAEPRMMPAGEVFHTIFSLALLR